FLVTKEILPHMMKRKGGMIVNIISYAAKTTYTGSAAYSAAKAGTQAMMNVVREEVRKHGIRIVNVYPGAVFTAMWSSKHRASMGDSMIPAEHLARVICEATLQPASLTTEEIVVRPPVGDLTV
ncbi:MAG TPA: SDR family NAD(P)-dependent oxidoreductase, partial [Bacteroidota bacterium]